MLEDQKGFDPAAGGTPSPIRDNDDDEDVEAAEAPVPGVCSGGLLVQRLPDIPPVEAHED